MKPVTLKDVWNELPMTKTEVYLRHYRRKLKKLFKRGSCND